MSTHPPATSPMRRRDPDSGAIAKAFAMLLGLAAAAFAILFLVMLVDVKEDVDNAVTPATAPKQSPDLSKTASQTSSSAEHFAGKLPANADELAAAHKPYPAEMPAIPPGNVVRVQMTLKDIVVEIAPGVKYRTWSFDGTGAPGPVVHVREGQTVEMTLTNGGSIPHSIDFHAARIAPDVAFEDVAPGKSFTFSFVANDPGVYMYHCGTKPVLAHIANGMYGAIVVEPAGNPLPKADKEYVLVSSEWYLTSDGIAKPADLDMAKAHSMQPDWITWNGYAGQYAKHPLTADPADTVRFWVVAAGPSLGTDFHVVGTVFDRAWVNQDMSRFQTGVQTVHVPAGGGAVFDVKIDEPGLYPFVSHSFASVDLGQVGLLKVGTPKPKSTQ